jgi:hypothetical protein
VGLGPAEDLSAIYPHGRGLDGPSALEEGSAGAEDGTATPMYVHVFHGSQGGGGLTRILMDTPLMAIQVDIRGMGILTLRTHNTLMRDTNKIKKEIKNVVARIWKR